MKLHLHVKSCYFEEIKAGTKTEEYRLVSSYWNKRIVGRVYTHVVIYNAYKAGAENRIEFPWRYCFSKVITHPHFGGHAAHVWAITLKAA